MKKITLLSTFLFCGMLAFGQQIFVEAYSGYQLTSYSDAFEESKGYVPIGFKLAGGHEHVQIGIDYRQHITNPTYTNELAGVDLTTQDFEETFYGAFLRGNVSTLPAYRFGFIASVGAGYYSPKLNTYGGEGTDNLLSTTDYDRKLGYNFYAGISAPIYSQIHWELGYQLNMVDHISDGAFVNTGNYHSIHVGISGNFVFGNTEKRCRRVIKQGGKNW